MNTIHHLSFIALTLTLAGCAGTNTTSRLVPRQQAGMPVSAEYHAVLIEPVTFHPTAAARLQPAERTELGEALARRARDQFAKHYMIVDAPASGVMRLRLNVEDIHKSSRVTNLFTAAVVFVPLDMGTVAAELIVEDSVSGERVAAITGKRKGSPLGPSGFFASFKPTGHAERGFDRLLQELVKLLTEPTPASAAIQAVVPASVSARPPS